MSMAIKPVVIDVSRYETVTDWAQVRQEGIRGVICKATEGTWYKDPTYAVKRVGARAAGLLWGAYHFLRPGDMSAQVKFFLDTAAPELNTLLALDYEDPRVALTQVKDWLRACEKQSRRSPLLYSGHVLKEKLAGTPDPGLGKYRLWLAQYGPRPVCPPGWREPWLWQFTGDGAGPGPHSIKGIAEDNIDVDSYAGMISQLEAEWAGRASPPAGDHT